jgi:hypothetical protein
VEKLENQNYFVGRERAQNNEYRKKRANRILKRKCDTPSYNFTEQRPTINEVERHGFRQNP